MKKVFYMAAMIAAILTLCGCRVTRQQRYTESHTSTTTVSDSEHFESLYISLRDSLTQVKAPVERSESRGLQHSFLETSLARSTASVDSAGVLSHSIENKDSIPSKIVFREIYHTIHDTLRKFKTDTLRLKDYTYLEREPGFWQEAQTKGFWMLLCVVVLLALRAAVKSHIKKF